MKTFKYTIDSVRVGQGFKQYVLCYWNVVLTLLAVFGYFHAFFINKLYDSLIAFVMWLAVSWLVALIQLVYGGWRYYTSKNKKFLHHCASCAFVAVLYGISYLLLENGYVLSA